MGHTLGLSHNYYDSRHGWISVLDYQVVFGSPRSNGYQAEIGRAVERALVDRLASLADGASMPQVRAIASHRLESLSTLLRTEISGRSEADEAHARLLARDIQRFLERPSQPFRQPAAQAIPPGGAHRGSGHAVAGAVRAAVLPAGVVKCLAIFASWRETPSAFQLQFNSP